MTLAVAIVTPQLAFVGADRRYSGAKALRDFKAAKMCEIQTSDGHGIITLAGVGARAQKEPFELSKWITHVLRGHNRTLDQSLHAIAEAATEQKLHELVEGHSFAFAGFTGEKMSLHTVTSMPQLFSLPARGNPTKLEIPKLPGPFKVINFNIPENAAVCAMLLGSGAPHVPGGFLLDLSRQARRARTKETAGERWGIMWSWINRRVARREVTVGPEVMCAWRYKDRGGKHICYAAGGARDNDSGIMPAVSQGMPVSDIVERLFNHLKTLKDPMDLMEMNQEITDKLMEGLETNPRREF